MITFNEALEALTLMYLEGASTNELHASIQSLLSLKMIGDNAANNLRCVLGLTYRQDPIP